MGDHPEDYVDGWHDDGWCWTRTNQYGDEETLRANGDSITFTNVGEGVETTISFEILSRLLRASRCRIVKGY